MPVNPYAGAIATLIQQRGQIAARHAEDAAKRSSQLVGNLAQIGANVAQQIPEMQKQLEVARDNKALQTALQTHTGPDGRPDNDAVIADLYRTRPTAAKAYETHVNDVMTKRYAMLKTKHETESLEAQLLAGDAQAVLAKPELFPIVRARVAKLYPGQEALMGEAFDKDRMQAIADAAMKGSEIETRRKNGADELEKATIRERGEPEFLAKTTRHFADYLSTFAEHGDTQGYQEALQHAPDFHVPASVVAAMPRDLTPDTAAQLQRMALTPAEQAVDTRSEKAATALETRTGIDDTRADKALAVSQAQLAVSQGHLRLASQQAGGGATTEADKKLVAAIMKTPSIFGTLTPTVQTRLAVPLSDAGFDFKTQGSGKPSTGIQKTALGFFNRAKQATEELEHTEDAIAGAGLLTQGWMNVAPNFAQSAQMQQYRQAQRAFTEARLRKESGAAIPPQEFKNDEQTYFVQPGDTAATVAQKRRARAATLAGFAFQAGPALGEFYGDDATGLIDTYKAQAKGQSGTARGPKEGDEQPVPGHPGVTAVYRGGRWIVK